MRALLITTAREDHIIHSYPNDGKLQYSCRVWLRYHVSVWPRAIPSVVAEGRNLL
jgi:hypothetical protein